ncbi:hypothetical protein Tco_1271616 [Tanacetum coccineum]
MRRKGKGFSEIVTPLFASMLVPQVVEGEGSGQPSEPQLPSSTALPSQEGQVSSVSKSHPQKTQTPRQAKRGQDTKIPQSSGPSEKVGDEAVHKELGDRVERVATTNVSLDAAQDSGNILKTQSTAIPNVPLSQEISIGGSPRCQEAIGSTIAQTRSERVSTSSYDSPLPGGHTPGSDEGRLKQDKLTDIVTALSQKVEGLESDLKKTKKLRRLTLVTSEDEEDLVAEDPSKQGRSLIEEMDLDAGISLVPPHVEVQGRYGQNLETQEGFGDGQEVSTAAQVSTASTFVSTASPQRNADTTADDLTLAETLMEIRKSAAKDKGKAKMDETESPRKMKQRERVQISRDEEVAQKLQEEFDAAERQRMAQVHQAAQGFTDAEWDDVLARVAADEDFVQQLQAGEKCSEEDLPMKLVELVNQRKKFFAQQRAEAKRNKPMTLAQQKEYMSNYIMNQEGDDLVKLWELVKEMFSTTKPTDDKEMEYSMEASKVYA